jgi:signal transduction histidine kinase/CheY-like chemotaxis protein
MSLHATHAEVRSMLVDLRQKLFSWLPLPTAFLAVYSYLLTSHVEGMQPLLVTGVTAGVVITSLLAQGITHRRWSWAVFVYMAGLLAAAGTLMLDGFLSLPALALSILVILLTVNLAGTWATLAVMLVITAVIGLSAMVHALPLTALLTPLGSLWIVAVIAWLAHRNLITALEWAWNSYHQSQRATEEARRHRAELAEVFKSLDSAYYRLERFSVQLAHARNAAEEARRAKQQFVANVSHELRTPLNIIIGFSESMVLSPESYGVNTIPRPFMGDINRIYRSAQHLKKLIDDVLDLSQIDAQSVPLFLERLPVSQVVIEAADMIEPLAAQKGLTLDLDLHPSLPPVLMDQLRVRQVLLNLLSNAVRFTDAGGIRVSTELEGEQIRVTVADTGPGIAPENLERVFEEFQQLDDPLNKRYDGTGLGLALSRRFVALHGGRMWVESDLGQGSHFSFALPLSAAGFTPINGRTPRPILMAQEVARHGPTVLVAAEEPMAANLLKRHLRDYQIKRISEAEVADAVESYLPHAIIRSNIDGDQESSDLLLAVEPFKPTLITCPLPDATHLARLLGVEHFLVKPIVREHLLDLLAAYGDRVRHLLIIDDDPQLGELILRMALAAPLRYTVEVACGGVEGLERMRERRPDLILLDYMMPEMTGLSVIEIMRSDEELRSIPVAMITARDVPGEELHFASRSRIVLDCAAGLTFSEVLACVQALLEVLPPPRPVVGAPPARSKDRLPPPVS